MYKRKIFAAFAAAAMGITMLAGCSCSKNNAARINADEVYGKWEAVMMTNGDYTFEGDDLPKITMDIKEGGEAELEDNRGVQSAKWEMNGGEFKIVSEKLEMNGTCSADQIILNSSGDIKIVFGREQDGDSTAAPAQQDN